MGKFEELGGLAVGRIGTSIIGGRRARGSELGIEREERALSILQRQGKIVQCRPRCDINKEDSLRSLASQVFPDVFDGHTRELRLECCDRRR